MTIFNIDEQEKKINTNLGFESKTKISIGGNDPSKFVPNINSSIARKIEDEFFININFTDLIVNGNEEVTYNENKTELKTDKRIDKWSILEDGKLDYEIVLEEKQPSNVLSLEIKCSKELRFSHQRELTQEEINEGFSRPDWSINSYAVFCNKIHNEYANGKVAHIERSWVEDKNGNRSWCEQNIEVNNGIGTWNITIPENIYNDESLYPLTVGPILGYSVQGSGTASTIRAIALKFEIPETVDMARIISINSYLDGSVNKSLGFYTNQSYDFGGGTIKDQPNLLLDSVSFPSADGWAKLNIDIFLPKSGLYWLALCGENNIIIHYDDDLTAQRAISSDAPFPLPSIWNPNLLLGTDENRKPTLWATYLEIDEPDVELIDPPDGSNFYYPHESQDLQVRINSAPPIPFKVNFYDAEDDSLIETVDNREISIATDYYNVPPYDFESNGSDDFITWESYKDDIIQIESGADFVVALLNNGTVLVGGDGVGTGPTDINVTGWNNIIQISASSNHLLGLKSDGTVLACGEDDYNEVSNVLNPIFGFINLIQVSAGDNVSVGLKADGSVVAVGNQMSMTIIGTWQNVIQISAGQNFLVALLSNGECVATGYNTYYQLHVTPAYGWTDIIKVATGTNHSVGLKSDGTCVTAFSTIGPHIDVNIVYGIDTWTDIVDIYATRYGTVGIKSDGTMVVAGFYNCILDTADPSWDLALANSRLLQNNNPDWGGVNMFALGWYNMYTFRYEVPFDTEITWNGTEYGYNNWYIDLAYNEEEEISIYSKKDNPWLFTIGNDILTLFSPYDGYEVSISEANPTTLVAKLELGHYNGPVPVIDFRRYPDESLIDTYEIETSVVALAPKGTDVQDTITLWNSTYTDIIFITGSDDHCYAIRSDGTCLSGGNSQAEDVSTWTDIVFIACSDQHVVGVMSDGTCIASGENSDGQCDVTGVDWVNIEKVSCGENHTVGLKSDGTCIAVGRNSDGRCDVTGEDWSNIKEISCGGRFTAGLRFNGTCIATGENGDGQCDVTVANGWENVVDIGTGHQFTVGLKLDGSLLVIGKDSDGNQDIYGPEWTDVINIAASGTRTVALRSDGTIIYTDNSGTIVSSETDVKTLNNNYKSDSIYYGLKFISGDPTVEYPIFSAGTYGWYAEFNNGIELIRTQPWSFTVTEPAGPIISDPNPVNDSSAYDADFIFLSVQVDDYQGGLIDVEFFASDGDPIGSTTVTAGERAQVPWAVLPIGNYGWYTVATDSDTNETISDVYTFSVVAALEAPTISNLWPTDGMTYYDDHVMWMGCDVSDPNLDETVNLSLYDASDDSLIFTKTNIDLTERQWIRWNINPPSIGTYSWYFVAVDSRGYDSTSETLSFNIIAAPEETTMSDPQPTQSSYFPFYGEPVNLSVLVTDPNIGDTITVTFYNGEDDSVIGIVEGVTSGERPEVPWNIDEYGYYCWYAKADDGTFISTSETFCFFAERYVVQTIPEQEIFLNTFSDNSVENIKQVQFGLIGDTKTIEEPLDYRNVVSYGGDLEISLQTNFARVTNGFCSIGGVLIEVQQNRDLYPNSVNSYIFSNDDIPLAGGLGTIEDTLYIVVYYNPIDEENNKAYLGFVRNESFINNDRNLFCILGEIKITIVDRVVTMNDIDLTNRDFIFNVFDGGWIF